MRFHRFARVGATTLCICCCYCGFLWNNSCTRVESVHWINILYSIMHREKHIYATCKKMQFCMDFMDAAWVEHIPCRLPDRSSIKRTKYNHTFKHEIPNTGRKWRAKGALLVPLIECKHFTKMHIHFGLFWRVKFFLHLGGTSSLQNWFIDCAFIFMYSYFHIRTHCINMHTIDLPTTKNEWKNATMCLSKFNANWFHSYEHWIYYEVVQCWLHNKKTECSIKKNFSEFIEWTVLLASFLLDKNFWNFDSMATFRILLQICACA